MIYYRYGVAVLTTNLYTNIKECKDSLVNTTHSIIPKNLNDFDCTYDPFKGLEPIHIEYLSRELLPDYVDEYFVKEICPF